MAAIISSTHAHLQMESKLERALMAGEVFGGVAADEFSNHAVERN